MRLAMAPALLALASIAVNSVFSPAAEAQALTTERVLTGLTAPVGLTAPPDDLKRLFIVERGGRIMISKNGQLLPTPFLDVDPLTNGGGEQGLLGLTFHPNYSQNGRFFINYTALDGWTHVMEYKVSTLNPDVAQPDAIQAILIHLQPNVTHNGGQLAFGPDGMLYIGMGDGGFNDDPGNRAQDPTVNLGKMLRLDVNVPPPFIPVDNPFVSDPQVNDEIWALGLRNPWRFSFDRLTGHLYISDVGQASREELNFQPASSPGGENYGWRCMEGSKCTGSTGCTCNDLALTLPFHEYAHTSSRCSIIGGYVYRGNHIPGLQGTYFFADFCSDEIWSLEYVGGVVNNFLDRTQELTPPIGFINSIASFGEDGAGELYIVDLGGEIYKIIRACEPPQNVCTSEVNSGGTSSIMEWPAAPVWRRTTSC
jgi:glucose/arabinose dehydrogenase